MPRYNDGRGYNLNNAAGYPAHTQVRESVVEVILDIAKIVAARAAADATALAAGDILEAIKLPAQSLVLAAGVAIEEVGDTGLTVGVGDEADPDGFVVGTTPADAVADFCSVGGAGAYAVGKYKSAAGSIDVVLGAVVPTTGVLRVWAKVVDGAGYYPISSIPSATP